MSDLRRIFGGLRAWCTLLRLHLMKLMFYKFLPSGAQLIRKLPKLLSVESIKRPAHLERVSYALDSQKKKILEVHICFTVAALSGGRKRFYIRSLSNFKILDSSPGWSVTKHLHPILELTGRRTVHLWGKSLAGRFLGIAGTTTFYGQTCISYSRQSMEN